MILQEPSIGKQRLFLSQNGHTKNECRKYHGWLINKRAFLILVCSKVNLTSVPRNTKWLGSGSTNHKHVSMQGFLSNQKPSG